MKGEKSVVRIKMEEDRMGNAAGLEGETAVVIITEKEENGKVRTGVALAREMKPLEFAAATGEAMRRALKTIAGRTIFPEELLVDIFYLRLKVGERTNVKTTARRKFNEDHPLGDRRAGMSPRYIGRDTRIREGKRKEDRRQMRRDHMKNGGCKIASPNDYR